MEIIHNNKKRERIAAFISIPKNASQSIIKILALGENRNEENTSSLVIHKNHQRAAILSQKYNLNKLFVFCFVRNPYCRCVSWYEFHKHTEPYNSLSFDDWVNIGMPHHWRYQNKTNYVINKISPLLQYNFIEHYKIDLIGKIETFSSDLNKIIEKLNLLCQERNIDYKFNYTNIKINTSKVIDNIENYYNEETKEKVFSLLKKDFEYFGYNKGIEYANN